MSDPMAGMGGGMGMAPGGAAPKGNPQQAAEGMRATRSVFHPTDMAAMQQTGDVSKNMTIAQFFAKFGIDVNKDPVTKLAQFTQDQLNKANPMTKMSAIAGGQPPTGPSPSPGGSPSGAPGGSPAPGGGGLASLMQQ